MKHNTVLSYNINGTESICLLIGNKGISYDLHIVFLLIRLALRFLLHDWGRKEAFYCLRISLAGYFFSNLSSYFLGEQILYLPLFS